MDFDEQEARQILQPDLVKKYALKVLKRWPVILVSFILALGIGYAINRYATPVYLVKARITTKKFSNKPSSPIPGLIDASFFLNGTSEVYEEIPILKSPKRIEAAIDRLDFKVSYFAEGDIKTMESLTGFVYTVKVDTLINNAYPYGLPIFVNYLNLQSFQLIFEGGQWADFVKGKTYRFGEPFMLGSARLIIHNNSKGTQEGNKYFFVLNSKAQQVNHFRNRLNIQWAMKGSSMLDLSMESELPDRELQFLNAYYEVVQEFGIREKNETLENTIRFIDSQMKSITDSLLYYQSLIDELKFSHYKINVPLALPSQSTVSGSDFIFSDVNALDKKKASIQMKERYFDYLTDYFKRNSTEEVFAPSLMGLEIPLVETWVKRFIEEKLTEKIERNEANQQNPLVNREDSVRRKLEKGIFEAIHSERQQNKRTIQELDKQANFLLGSIKDVQVDFRQLAQYQRLFQLNQTLFDLFIRRKTEAAISKASATSDYDIIDVPSYSKMPIRPDTNMNLLIAAVIGLFLPIGFFLFRDLTNSRIMDKDDLLAHTQIPMLGNIAHSDFTSRLVMKEYPRSVVAESFRAVRANLKFLAPDLPNGAHTFLITSSVGGEGKTFCSLNLAFTLALGHKKVVVIGADMRKPELGNYLEMHSAKGLSTYLSGHATWDEIIFKNEVNQPHVIDAGKVPPNPSELLASERMRFLIDYLKENYDYVIIDTPPIGLVSDAMELFKYCDYSILIVRQCVTDKAALSMVNELYLDGKMKNFSVLLNDIELIRRRKSIYGGYIYGMGYGGYGYGYYQEDKKKKDKAKS